MPPDEPTDQAPEGDWETVFDNACTVAEAAVSAANQYEGNMMVLGVATQILLSRIVQTVSERGVADQYRHDLHAVLAQYASDDLLRWLEYASRSLPLPAEAAMLAESLLASAVMRSRTLNEATIATSAVSGKLAGLMMAAIGITADQLAERIGADIWRVQDSLSDSVKVLKVSSGDQGQSN